MSSIYVHHRVTCEPRTWSDVAKQVIDLHDFVIRNNETSLYGLWRSQIGLPRDTITMISVWPDLETAKEKSNQICIGMEMVSAVETCIMRPTIRPKTNKRPRRQGNYAFRWFDTPLRNLDEFLKLCFEAWPDFESSYDSQIIGLWKIENNDKTVKTLLLTRRPNLAMWERSKIPEGPKETSVREKLSRRYDLCDWTTVYTTTLLTASDDVDLVRWS
ncbi:MAG: hypothetical protein ACJZ2G_03350 [Thalassobaculaceae bacterium]|tara:strand:+ start:364 stop:1011 length:648 start_codon:yes stop_codon:yes gene_type:complete